MRQFLVWVVMLKFLRTKLSAAYYKPLFQIGYCRAFWEVGHISGLGDKVTQSKRFYLGGRTIRGFDGAGIGPRDAGSGDSVGGNTMYSGRVEVFQSWAKQGYGGALDSL